MCLLRTPLEADDETETCSICLSVLLGLVDSATCARTNKAVTNRPAGPFSYDFCNKVIFNGDVAIVLSSASKGSIPASRSLIVTSSRPVDVNLGPIRLKGQNALLCERRAAS